MNHVWLPTLGVWAQAHEMPSDRGVTSNAEQSTALTSCAEHRRSYNTEKRERHCHDDHICSQNDMHGDCDLQSIGDGHHGHRDDYSRQHGCHHHSVGDEFHHHGHGYCKSCDEPQHTCPICLSPVIQSDLTVLRWCMHRFCLTCIEKWSIMQRFCPLCKQIFHGWYYNIQSPSVFDKKDLAIKSSSQSSSQRRAQGRRERSSIFRGRISKPYPWRRTLRRDHLGRVAESEGDEQALQWRASIYKKKLRAVPFILNSRVKIHQAPLSDPERRARIERRLEPWIRRELQAITGDLDHSLLVHLVLSLWLWFLSEKEQVCGDGSSGRPPLKTVPQAGFRDVDALRQLEPFLQEKASSFWHELRCFGESPYSLRAYDSVIKYEKYRG